MKNLSEGTAGQLLALLVAVLGMAVFYLVIASPILDYYGEREELLDQRVAVAQHYQTLAHQLPGLREADKKWRNQEGGELLLEGSSDALAFASLQAAMKGLVEEAGASLSSSEVLQPTTEGRFRRVGIRVVFSGDLKLVTAVLKGAETSRPILSVGDFSLQTRGGSGSANSNQEEAQTEDDGSLSVTLDVYGFRAGA
jgi:hypothetical protein